VVLGTSATLREMIKFENGAVTNPTFAEYAPITMREAPPVKVTFVENPRSRWAGLVSRRWRRRGGIANALYDLTGIGCSTNRSPGIACWRPCRSSRPAGPAQHGKTQDFEAKGPVATGSFAVCCYLAMYDDRTRRMQLAAGVDEQYGAGLV
jgi:hypothetical protein